MTTSTMSGPDRTMTQATAGTLVGPAEHFDLCILGAGPCGLNALCAAAEHLGDGARILLVDRNDRPGGMWTSVYGHCRLHQPHPSFTVGHMPWAWTRPDHYLATGREVLGHLNGCYQALNDRLTIRECFGHEVIACHENGSGAVVALRKLEPGSGTGTGTGTERPVRQVVADRVIQAYGFDVPAQAPLRLSSSQVTSLTPRDLTAAGAAKPDAPSDAPVYVIGGGKTGMDTAHAVISTGTGRAVRMLNGSGSVFARRDQIFPSRLRRWWSGVMVADMFTDMADRFDGTNETTCFEYFRAAYGHGVGARRDRFLFGILSEAEQALLDSGLDEVINDYLCDVVDGPDGPEMVLRSGARRPVAPGSVFVNCTGHVLRGARPYRPYLSDNGAILTISTRSMVHFLSTMSAYFMTHLFMRGRLRDAPLYELDSDALLQKSNHANVLATFTMTLHNMLVFLDLLPLSVVLRCRLDLDGVYPTHRRALALLRMKLSSGRRIAACRAALDRVAGAHGVRCGPLVRPQADGRRTTRAA